MADKGGYAYISPVVNLQCTSTLASPVVNSAKAYFLKTQNSMWLINFSIFLGCGNAAKTAGDITILNISWAFNQASACASNNGAFLSGGLTGTVGTGIINTSHASFATSYYAFSGELYLSAKPTAYLPDGV